MISRNWVVIVRRVSSQGVSSQGTVQSRSNTALFQCWRSYFRLFHLKPVSLSCRWHRSFLRMRELSDDVERYRELILSHDTALVRAFREYDFKTTKWSAYVVMHDRHNNPTHR